MSAFAVVKLTWGGYAALRTPARICLAKHDGHIAKPGGYSRMSPQGAISSKFFRSFRFFLCAPADVSWDRQHDADAGHPVWMLASDFSSLHPPSYHCRVLFAYSEPLPEYFIVYLKICASFLRSFYWVFSKILSLQKILSYVSPL